MMLVNLPRVPRWSTDRIEEAYRRVRPQGERGRDFGDVYEDRKIESAVEVAEARVKGWREACELCALEALDENAIQKFENKNMSAAAAAAAAAFNIERRILKLRDKGPPTEKLEEEPK